MMSPFHRFLIAIAMIIFASSSVFATCDPDENNSEKEATPIGFSEKASGVVCPDDPFDFYVLKVPSGREKSGNIKLTSPQESTVLRIYNKDKAKRLVDDLSTTESEKEINVKIGKGGLSEGTYYARISFWSDAAYEHDYELEINLEPDLRFIKNPPPTEGGSEEEDETLRIRTATPLRDYPRVIGTAPWPSKRANARNTGRSTFNGPAGNFHKLAEFSLSGYQSAYGPRFTGLRVGLDNMAYFVDTHTNLYTGFNLTSGKQWEEIVNQNYTGPVLGTQNKSYLIKDKLQRLYCIDVGGESVWNLSSGITPYYNDRRLTEIWALGQKVYITKNIMGNTYLYAYGTDGAKAWHTAVMKSIAVGVAEGGGFVYAQTQWGLYQFSLGGTKNWEEVYDRIATPNTSLNFLGPIVGQDGRVWINSPWYQQYKVFDSDGTEYRTGSFNNLLGPGNTLSPRAVCAGSNDKFYVAGYDNVACFSDWTELEWNVTIPGGSNVKNMILGDDNTIYVAYQPPGPGNNSYSHHIVSIDPDDGHIIADVDMNVPEDFAHSSSVELAIGEDNKLVVLLNAGYLAVFEPYTFILEPGVIFKKQIG